MATPKTLLAGATLVPVLFSFAAVPLAAQGSEFRVASGDTVRLGSDQADMLVNRWVMDDSSTILVEATRWRRHNPFLEPLRGMPRFEALLARAREGYRTAVVA